ncbi:MAG TPA: hypothetical protein VIZ17_15860 [Acetobacteraceae bacterium]
MGTMIALGKWDEFRMHVKPVLASRQFSLADVTEVVLQQAIYCGLPAELGVIGKGCWLTWL